MPSVSISFGAKGRSSEAREDNEVEDEEGRGLSAGEMLVEEDGVESVVASLRRAASCGRAVVAIAVQVDGYRHGATTKGEGLSSSTYLEDPAFNHDQGESRERKLFVCGGMKIWRL